MLSAIRLLIVCLGLVWVSAGWTGESAIPAELPLSEVVLYTSGVGSFQRDGLVDGSAHAELRFKAEQINDLLKSLVVRDLDGGAVRVVTYDSRDPVAKTLKSFTVDLTDNLSLSQLLERLRGEPVDVAAPGPVRGTVLGIEKKTEQSGDKVTREVGSLTLLTADGLRAVPLEQIQRIQLANPRLQQELGQALALLAASRDTQKKGVRLDFSGQGRRRVRVAYIGEAPVWKMSYRLALTENGKPYLQGWAIVENTTDEDWEQVKLSLVSGRPISFTMDLYEPVYVKRPSVALELYQSLRPPVYEQATGGGAAAAAVPSEMPVMRPAAPAMALPAPMYSPPRGGEVRLQEGVSAAAQGGEAGELFQYVLRDPVSLARHKSAMLPVVGEEVQGAKLAIYNERVHAKHPLNGFRLKNSTGLHLMQGPITVFEGGIYAGDARLGGLAPGQERLLSYALDLKTEVESARVPEQELLVSASLKKGVLLASRKLVQERAYAVTNRDAKRKTVLVEHPFRADWRLVVPAASSERTRDVYRFEMGVAPGATERLRVREERLLEQRVELGNASVVEYYLRATQVSPQVKEALRRVVVLRDRIGKSEADRRRREAQLEAIAKEQGRIRENMDKVARTSELYARYVKKLDEQESEIERLRMEAESLRAAEAREQRALEEYLLGLDLE